MLIPPLLGAVVGLARCEATFRSSTTTAVSNSSVSMTFGPAFAGRVLVIGIGTRAGSSLSTISGVSIGGVSATELQNRLLGGDTGFGIFWARVPTGTSGTVAWSISGSGGIGSGCALHSITNFPSSASPSTDYAGSGALASFTLNKRECVVAYAQHGGTDPGAGSIAGGTLPGMSDDASLAPFGARFRAGRSNTNGTGTITSSGTSSFNGIGRAVFAP